MDLLKGIEKLFHTLFSTQSETAALSRQKLKKIKKNSRIFLVQREASFPFPSIRNSIGGKDKNSNKDIENTMGWKITVVILMSRFVWLVLFVRNSPTMLTIFSDSLSHLKKRVCLSVYPSVGLLVTHA